MSKFGNYVTEAYDELIHKVSWPTWSELQQTTLIVIVALAVTTLLLLGMNFVSDNLMKLLYSLTGRG